MYQIHTVFGSENIIIQEPIYVHSNPVVGSLAVPIAVAEGGDNPIVPVTVPSQVPAGWNPVVADVVVLPAVSYVTANTVEQDEGDESDAPVAYVAPPAYNYEGFNVLLQILDGAYDQQTELSRWLCFAGTVFCFLYLLFSLPFVVALQEIKRTTSAARSTDSCFRHLIVIVSLNNPKLLLI